MKPRPTMLTRDNLFLRFMKAKGPTSAKTYRSDLADLAAWVSGAGSAPRAITDEQIATVMFKLVSLEEPVANEIVMRYRTHLIEERMAAASTVNRRMSTIRSYVALANAIQVTSVKIQVPRARPNPASETAVDSGAYAKMLKAAEQRYKSSWSSRNGNELLAARDRAILVLYHDASLRRFEPLKLKYPEDVELDNERIRLRTQPRARGWFPITKRCVLAIKDLLKVRGHRPGYLFYSTSPNHYGKPLTTRAANRIISKTAATAGVHATPDTLRHTKRKSAKR